MITYKRAREVMVEEKEFDFFFSKDNELYAMNGSLKCSSKDGFGITESFSGIAFYFQWEELHSIDLAEGLFFVEHKHEEVPAETFEVIDELHKKSSQPYDEFLIDSLLSLGYEEDVIIGTILRRVS